MMVTGRHVILSIDLSHHGGSDGAPPWAATVIFNRSGMPSFDVAQSVGKRANVEAEPGDVIAYGFREGEAVGYGVVRPDGGLIPVDEANAFVWQTQRRIFPGDLESALIGFNAHLETQSVALQNEIDDIRERARQALAAADAVRPPWAAIVACTVLAALILAAFFAR